MKQEDFKRANEIRENIKRIEDIEMFFNDSSSAYFVASKTARIDSGIVYIPKSLNKTILNALSSAKDQLEQEFKEL